ncbi:POK19 protein, partial [Hypocryptadius cinnamomeus]|nr:POK19 protein [Hypocryptadius cinnamomeus]
LHVETHLTACFAVMGVPAEIKTDNGPAHSSQRVARFMTTWGIKHVRGIPHSLT